MCESCGNRPVTHKVVFRLCFFACCADCAEGAKDRAVAIYPIEKVDPVLVNCDRCQKNVATRRISLPGPLVSGTSNACVPCAETYWGIPGVIDVPLVDGNHLPLTYV